MCCVCIREQVALQCEPEVMENMQRVYPGSLNNEQLTEREGEEKRVRGREGERRVMKRKTSFFGGALFAQPWLENHVSVSLCVCVC